MQPLNWDTASRTPLSESFNIYTGVDSLRSATESFGDHLYRSNSTPLPASPPAPRESARPEAVAPPPPPPPAPAHSNTSSGAPAESYAPASADKEHRETSNHESSTPAESSTKSPPPTNESAAASEETNARREQRSDVDPEDSKSSPLQRNRANSRRLAAKIDPQIESAQLAAEAESQGKAKKRFGAIAPKTKGTARSKQQGTKSDEVDPNASGTKSADPAQAAVLPNSQALEPPADHVGNAPFDLVEDAQSQDVGDAQALPMLAEAASTEQVFLVEGSEGDRPNSSGKRNQRGTREELGIGAIQDLDSALAAERTPDSLAVQPVDESAAPIDTANLTAGSESTKTLKPAAAASPTSEAAPPHLRFAQHLTAKSGARPVKTSPLTDMEHARLIDRVARAFQTAEARGGSVTLRLHPPELGSLRVELRLTDGVLSARLEAETPTARTLLLDNVQMLHDRLAEQGVRIERFDVDLLDHRSPGDSAGFEQNGTRDQNQRQPSTSDTSVPDSRETESVRPNPRPGAPGNLNVIV